MNDFYYKDMPEEFQKAVKVIQQYCQNEDCTITDCNKCPYTLAVIRCGDVIEGKEIREIRLGDIYEDEEKYRWQVVKIDNTLILENIEVPGFSNIDDIQHMKYLGNVKDNPELLEMGDSNE